MRTIQNIKDYWFQGMVPWDWLEYNVRGYGDKFEKLWLTDLQRFYLSKEWGEWERLYLPDEGVRGKTVLDVGAGGGETALFFLKHGASRVVCIEPNPRYCDMLRLNARSQGWRVEVIERKVRHEDLMEGFDFLKMDAEGAEDLLLEFDAIYSASFEIHGIGRYLDFRRKFPRLKYTRTAMRRWIAQTR